MPIRFDNRTGLCLHIVKLDGKLSIRFTSDSAMAANYTFEGTDLEETGQITTQLKMERRASLPSLKAHKLQATPADGQYIFPFLIIHTVDSTDQDPVFSIFATFNEHSSNPLKRPAENEAGDYRAYKHVFVEGYRTGPGDDHNEEGRLHIDLAHHEMIWESYDDFEGGTRVTLDRLSLPACVVENVPLETAHFFSDNSLHLCCAYKRNYASNSISFSMGYSRKDNRVFVNNTGTGAERFYFTGEDKMQVAIDAVQDDPAIIADALVHCIDRTSGREAVHNPEADYVLAIDKERFGTLNAQGHLTEEQARDREFNSKERSQRERRLALRLCKVMKEAPKTFSQGQVGVKELEDETESEEGSDGDAKNRRGRDNKFDP
ncbi:hypothetical protein K458DRAFT_381487 [Lentithecium fluviatile CBS 122367]|uniref:Uncharacterized protein n=1 Tax=Lentithecium fluviatile CBS 122367 TaxID=1168545 RepID=A0A6G1JN24_9PLEO|nr:hypothetical protein K458DRAFT_381487 [Lentithecium fluviatile CBS 122367]